MKNRLFKICIIFFITGLIISALAFVSFFGKLRDSKAESVTNAATYIINALNDDKISSTTDIEYDEDGNMITDSEATIHDDASDAFSVSIDELSADELAGTIEATAHTYLMTENSVEDVFAYSIKDNAFCGEEDPLLTHPDKSEIRVSDGYIYTPYSYSQDVILWFRNSAELIEAELMEYVRRYSVIFILSFMVVCLILATIMKLWMHKPKAMIGIYILLFVWVISMYGIFAFGMSNIDMEYGMQYSDTRMSIIEADVKAYLDIPDSDIEESYEWFIEEDQAYASFPAETVNDKRSVLLRATIDFDDQFDPSSITYSPKANIWDMDIPIESRVDVAWDHDAYTKMLTDYLLQTIMIGIFASLLMIQILSLDKKRTFVSAVKPEGIDDDCFALLVRNTAKMKHLLIVKSFSTTLIAALHISMIKSWLSHDYGEYPSGYVNTVIIAASLLGCLTVFAVPQLYKLCRNSVNYVRIALPVCAAGSLACFFAQNSTVFIIGYLIFCVGDGFSNMSIAVYYMSHNTEAEAKYALRQIGMTGTIGSTLGAVIGGVMAIVIASKYMYLIAAVCIIGMLFYSFSISADSVGRKLPEHSNLSKILGNKEAQYFFALIIIPFGFQSYFFSYQVSIDAADMGLTTVVVSFVFFIRNAFKLLVKKSNTNRKFWRNLPLKLTAPLGILLSSMLFLAYIPLKSPASLIIVSLVLAYVEASLNSKVYSYNFVLLESDMDSVFTNSAMIVSGRRIGKTIAPMLVQVCTPVILPIVMFTGGAVCLIRNHLKKQ